jgi:hypothetical protein
VTFGLAFDRERLLRNVTVAYATRNEPGKVVAEKMDVVGLGVAEKALVVAESLIAIRQNLFTQVYWHHTVRSLKAMLGFAVRNILLWLKADGNKAKDEEFWAAFHAEVLCAPTGRQDSRALRDAAGSAGEDHRAEDDWLGEYRSDGIINASGLGPSDDALLLFFRRFARPREQRMIDFIRGRKLFKRLYVLTSSREKHAYDQIYGRFHTYRLEGNLSKIEQLRKSCEDVLRTTVLEKVEENEMRHRPGVDWSAVKEQIASADPLILLDVPVKAVSRSIEKESIYFMPEDIIEMGSQRAGREHLMASPAALEEAPFDKEVGKIRLFAPPDLKDVLLQSIPEHHETITECLNR